MNTVDTKPYTEYRGESSTREDVANKLANFTGSIINGEDMIITPGTEGALI